MRSSSNSLPNGNIFTTTGPNGEMVNNQGVPLMPGLRVVTVLPPIAEDDNEEDGEVLRSVRDSLERSNEEGHETAVDQVVNQDNLV